MEFKRKLKVFLGTGLKTADDFRVACRADKIAIGHWGDYMLNKFIVASVKTELNIVVTSPADLGFKNGVIYGDFCARAENEFYLKRCPAEIGPQMCLQNKNLLISNDNKTSINVVHEPIITPHGHSTLFCAMQFESNLWLTADVFSPVSVVHPDFLFAFSC